MAKNCKTMPANIGLPRVKAEIWESNPFFARPYQNYTFQYSADGAKEIKSLSDKQNIQFVEGSGASLLPIHSPEHTFIAVRKLSFKKQKIDLGVTNFETTLPYIEFDIAKGLSSSPTVLDYLPGGEAYRPDYFAHKLWIHIGSLYSTSVVLPSEYVLPPSSKFSLPIVGEISAGETVQRIFNIIKTAFLAESGAAIWDMTHEPFGDTPVQRVYPRMVGRINCKSSDPVNWTIEKYTPLFQGQDFSLEFRVFNKDLAQVPIRANTVKEEMETNRMIGKYKTYFEPSTQDTPWVNSTENGYSNEAYYIQSDPESAEKSWVEHNKSFGKYYFKNKPYLLIEVGVNDYQRTEGHNYFIELMWGSHPRFLHFSPQPRGHVVTDKEEDKNRDIDFYTEIRQKCRVLGELTNLSVNDLFTNSDGRFVVMVQNFLGDLLIKFKVGKDETDWFISRTDQVYEPNEVSKLKEKRVPMIIPNGPMRIHGGNMTVGFSFQSIAYAPSGTVSFKDREADIGENNGEIYATFAQPGDNDEGIPRTKNIPNAPFKKPVFDLLKMGYSCDAYELTEIHNNQFIEILPYRYYTEKYKKFGREWALRRDGEKKGFIDPSETPTKLVFNVLNRIPTITREKLTTNADGSKEKTSETFMTSGGVTSGLFDMKGIPQSILDDPDRVYVGQWDVNTTFFAGSMLLPKTQKIKTIDGIELSDGGEFVEKNCITPVVKCWSLIVPGGGKVVTEDMKFDISEYVTNVNDGWNGAQDWATINHEAKLDLYLPLNAISIDSSKVNKILALQNKTFFITLSYWWENGAGLDTSVSQYYGISKLPKAHEPENDPSIIQLTGICNNLTLTRTVNKIIGNMTIKDYSEVLKTSYIMNSPFFDAMRDINAIYELARLGHLDDSAVPGDLPGNKLTNGVDRRPLGYLRKLHQTPRVSFTNPLIYNGNKYIDDIFNLPGTYADLQDQSMKFNNGDTIFDAISKMVKIYGKTFYFDQWGVLIVEVSPAAMAAFKTDMIPIEIKNLVKAGFITTPRGKSKSNENDTQLSNRIFSPPVRDFVDFDPDIHAPFLIDTQVQIEYASAESVNHIALFAFSVEEKDPETGEQVGGYIAEGRTFYDQIWKPEAEGFFGYRKLMFHSEGIYGNRESLRNALNFYARFKYPPLKVSFECWGVPGLKAFDIIMLNEQPLYITEISQDLNIVNRGWRMRITGEWIKSFDKTLAFLDPSAVDITRPPI